ncbi:MAG TPA: hypothetical protein VLJ21_01030 [Candidatus Binatia bacterium]|nr:hypothetical protein [Candidatus Binatia bacterium]
MEGKSAIALSLAFLFASVGLYLSLPPTILIPGVWSTIYPHVNLVLFMMFLLPLLAVFFGYVAQRNGQQKSAWFAVIAGGILLVLMVRQYLWFFAPLPT